MKVSKIFPLVAIVTMITFTSPALANSTVKAVAAPGSKNIFSTYLFEHNLSTGMISGDVQKLQEYLNAHGFIISQSGAGSIGKETNKFGAATYAALIKFQKANKILPASGSFGPLTRKIINKTQSIKARAANNSASASAHSVTVASAVISSSLIASTTDAIASTTSVVTSISNGRIIAANPCTSWTYTDWSDCSPWHNQTRSILTSWPANCSGGAYVLEQACDLTANPATSTAVIVATSTILANMAASNASSTNTGLDNFLLAAAFVDNTQDVGLSCKLWVNKILGEATGGLLSLPFSQANNYSWALDPVGRVIDRKTTIENADRADILQFVAGDTPHTAIIVTKTPTGMVWIHSNWEKSDVVSVDFINYTYFNSIAGNNYSIYHVY